MVAQVGTRVRGATAGGESWGDDDVECARPTAPAPHAAAQHLHPGREVCAHVVGYGCG
eukprot:SAG25_NODE_150_length_13701_cov_6.145640_6_plen_58_part_00